SDPHFAGLALDLDDGDVGAVRERRAGELEASRCGERKRGDRKSTRLNSSHLVTSYAVFCLKKKINNLIQRNQSAAFSSGKVRPNHETNINIIARRTGKDVNSHTVLDGIITTIMATIQRINIIGSREGIFFLRIRKPPKSTLFPYTTLFR